MNKNTGGPAFPMQFNGTTEPSLSGMTLRDYFAAKAMQAILTHGVANTAFTEDAEAAYKMADAMIKERKA